MKKLIITFTLIALYIPSSFSQCTINTFIEDNYMFDAKVLALREIISDPSDPDYDNPNVPEVRIIPYLEKLSAIYEQADNEPLIDLLFNEYQIHANEGTMNSIFVAYKEFAFGVENNTVWLADFIKTGVSGDNTLDQLMTDFQFTINTIYESSDLTYFYIESALDFVNITALIDDFESVVGINYTETVPSQTENGVYNGVPYEIVDGVFAQFCDIVFEDDQFTFSVHGGDCPAGCIYSDDWSIYVSEDCEVILNINPFEVTEFVFNPNPVSNILQIHLKTFEYYTLNVYSIQGKQVNKYQNSPKFINVSRLNTGIYFIEIKTKSGSRQVKRFIKN